jgi:CCR4-NOT transcription complex subunit 2
MDDSRYQSALGHMPATRQPQTTSVDDFPPLGRHGTDENDDGRVNMMHASGYGGFSNSNAFSLPPDQVQLRNSLASASDSQANNTRSPSVVDRLTSPNGNGFDGMSCEMLENSQSSTNASSSNVKWTLSR